MAKKLVIPITGLHCRACELLNEENLQKIPGVKDARVNQATGQARIYYEGEVPSRATIKKVLEEAGYGLGEENDLAGSSIVSDLKRTNWQLIIPLLVLAYFLVSQLKFGDLSSRLNGEFSFSIALLVGLVAGVSTCLALVGGLVFAVAANYTKNHPQATKLQKFMPHIFFNVGRVVGFFFLGGLLGLFGSMFKPSPLFNGLLTAIVGIVILILGLKLLNVSPFLNKIEFALPKSWGKKVKANNPWLLGALTFFLPCGFTQAMQIYALNSGNFWSGGLTMAFFALGTAPGLLGIGGLGSLLNPKKSKNFFKVAGVIIILFALFNLQNSGRLIKISSSSLTNNQTTSLKLETDLENSTKTDAVQIVRMVETNRGYSPSELIIQKNKPVRWIIDAQAPYSCASSLIVPSLRIQKQLKAGENIIEFTPQESGVIPFSCSMGMYTGRFIVK